MQPTNRARTGQVSRCIYCGATTRGKGCRYAPHGVHFHPDDPRKCAYCGSPNYGKGCKVNPTNDLHIHGINYNSMFKEQVKSFVNDKVLLNHLTKDFTTFEAYHLKLIDEHGNKIKNPQSVEETLALNPYVKTIIKLKKYLGSKLDLLQASHDLESNSIVFEEIEKYKKILHFKDKISENLNELFKTLDEANQEGLTEKEIYELINA
jgi:hypothetical protein